MSHITTGTTKITCLKALAKAVAELGATLVVAEQGKKAEARGWGGSRHLGDAVAKLPGSYDVAFNRQVDGTLATAADYYDGSVERQFGPKLSKLTDVYFAHRLTDKYKAKGMFVQRTVNSKGGIRLTVTGGKL